MLLSKPSVALKFDGPCRSCFGPAPPLAREKLRARYVALNLIPLVHMCEHQNRAVSCTIAKKVVALKCARDLPLALCAFCSQTNPPVAAARQN